MTNIISSLAPVFLLIATGYFLRRVKFLNIQFWRSASKLTYYILFPALLINTLAFADLEQESLQPLIVSLGAPVLVISAILALINRNVKFDGTTFSSIFQGSIRPNTFVSLAIVIAIFDQQGLILAAIAIAVLVPLANLLSVITLTQYVKKNDLARSEPIIQILMNPLIIACALGLSLNVSEINLPLF